MAEGLECTSPYLLSLIFEFGTTQYTDGLFVLREVKIVVRSYVSKGYCACDRLHVLRFYLS